VGDALRMVVLAAPDGPEVSHERGHWQVRDAQVHAVGAVLREGERAQAVAVVRDGRDADEARGPLEQKLARRHRLPRNDALRAHAEAGLPAVDDAAVRRAL